MRNKPYRLSAAFVRTVKTPGRYGDGRGSGGLSLMVKATARGDLAKSWAQRLIVDGRPRMIGLGSYPHVSLAEAREACILNRAALRRGDLVLAGRKRTVPTFEEAVEKVVEMHATGWEGRRQECGAVAFKSRGLRIAETRTAAGEPSHNGGRDGRPPPDLEHEEGDGAKGPAAGRRDHEVGGCEGLPRGQPRR